MADGLDDDVLWENTQNLGSGPEVSDDEDNDDPTTAASNNKKLKRKQKFSELKDKRRKISLDQRELDTALATTSNNNNKSSLPQSQQLAPHEMVQLVNGCISSNLIDGFETVAFEESTFFYPDLDLSQITESQTKLPCPFVRALSVMLPNYRKLLTAADSTDSPAEENGSPLILIICSSAQRATEIIRDISAKIIKCRIVKLFAKHIKLAEQIETLSKEYHPVAVGTPHRVHDLIHLGALSLSRLQLCLIDHTADSKNFTVLTLPDVRTDLTRLLCENIYPLRNKVRVALIQDTVVEHRKGKKDQVPGRKK